MSIDNNHVCTDCGDPIGRKLLTFWKKGEYSCGGRDGCSARLCQKCHEKHPLFVPPSSEMEQQRDLHQATIQKFCKSCFQDKSVLDFSKTFDVIEGIKDDHVTFVFVHGGSASRALFRAHAMELKTKYGHGSILLDLPGHGSLVDTPLSLDSCATTLESVLNKCGLLGEKRSDRKVIYVGASLGAYVGFHLLDKLQSLFDGAILIDCGQNVGPGASFKAKAGLVMLSYMGNHMSNATLFGMMKDVAKKSGADYKLMESTLGAGMFFDQAQEQVDCLRAVAPADKIPNLSLPILFMNGTKDYRDSEDKWLELCTNEKSQLHDYEGGDHFFTHHSKFVDDILTRWHEFALNI